MKQTIFAFGCLVFIVVMMGYAINTALGLPNVHFDYETNECVYVDNFGGTNYTCEDLPKRFYHVWVIDGQVSENRHQAGE